jgi:phosphoserine phosphatase RsbU/P
VSDEPDLATLYDDLPCGILTTRFDGTIIHVNNTFLDWTGYRRDELLESRRFVDLLSPGGRLYHETHYMPMLQMESAVREIALDIIGRDEQRVPILVNAQLVQRDANAPVCVRVALFKATQRREYERELLREKRRAEESEAHANELARTLQTTLIPPSVPTIEGLDIAAVYRPAGDGAEVGGDFYDVFQIAAGDWALAIGDVCGKGVDAAVVTALVRYTARAAAVEHHEPARVLDVVNEMLIRHDTDRFCTAAFLRLRRSERGWVVTLSRAGHPPPLVKRHGDGSLTEAGRPGPLLGVFEQPTRHDDAIALAPGDVVVLYTDGVTEGRRSNDFFGEDRLAALVAAIDGTAQLYADRILEEVLAYQRNDTRDDIAIVVVRVPEHTGRADFDHSS